VCSPITTGTVALAAMGAPSSVTSAFAGVTASLSVVTLALTISS
jgi:hypothetical protein